MDPAVPVPGRRLPLPLLLLGGALAALCAWAAWPTLAYLAGRWTSEPQYSHGYVVPVLAGVILFSRRRLLPTELRPSWWGLPFFAVAAGLLLSGGYFYYPWYESFALLPLAAGLALVVGGWAALRWAWPAVLFLVFMLPLPFQAETALAQPLQGVATAASVYALQTLGLPAVADGNIILVNDHRLEVAQACSGLAMLMTFFALSAAVALVVRRPWYDRVIVFLSAVPVAVLMYVLRITATGVLYVTAGGEVAHKVFHDLAGWLMMPAALVALWLELRLLGRLFVPVTQSATHPSPAPAVPS